MKKIKRPRILVRCLGYGKEHQFLSPDPSRIRKCDKCREREEEKLERARRKK